MNLRLVAPINPVMKECGAALMMNFAQVFFGICSLLRPALTLTLITVFNLSMCWGDKSFEEGL